MVSFPSAAAFRAWLRKHHRSETALVLRLARKGATAGITYAEALDEALCFGWIDGIRRRVDAESFAVRFTPRKPRSIWSRVNVAHVERLLREKRMTKPGLAAFAARTPDRTGIYSFERAASSLPVAYQREFEARKRAWQYFQGAPPSYRRISTHWVISAKREETRRRRLDLLIRCSAEGTRIPQLRRD
ncbi:MAG TPA: YdeI/OmpD-associated family protein [Gemmatimonadales bacterium]|nr:YdeI/OmpD-associated family protein [Gemmatimonadales bacterium]